MSKNILLAEVIILTLLSFFVASSTGLECYHCDEYQLSSDTVLRDCDAPKLEKLECNSDGNRCYKAVENSKYGKVISKGCVSVKLALIHGYKDMACFGHNSTEHEVAGKKIKVHGCLCREDNCNTAVTTKTSGIISILPFAFILFTN